MSRLPLGSCFEPVAFAGEGEDGAVVDKTVDDGGCRHGIGKDLGPAFEG